MNEQIILKEAMLFDRLTDNNILCKLCPHYCTIAEGARGICQVRENRGGELYSLVYGRTVAQHIDPIEKKPLFHFYPGSSSYSLATSGCNFHCQYCTNWQVSQMPAEEFAAVGTLASPEEIVRAAVEAGCGSIAYTYVEPTIFFEYVYEISMLAREAGLLNLFKTNGFMSSEAIEIYHPLLDAANVDLKAFSDRTYQQFGGRLEPVLNTLRQLRRLGVWLEVTTVVIPGVNDGVEELRELANFIVQQLGVDTPWHVGRFFPAFGMMDVPPTPVETLHRARQVGLDAGLRYVYLASLLETGMQDTVCDGCGFVLVRRRGSQLIENAIERDCCPSCGVKVAGVSLKNIKHLAI
jgi:pyruvate formate lyase activating enzyme